MNMTRFLTLSFCALLLTACASGGGYSNGGYSDRGYNSGRYDGYARCYDCGTVERIANNYLMYAGWFKE